MYPYVYANHKGEVTKYYSPLIRVTCGKYKDMTARTARYYQFTLSTGYGIDTNKNFISPEQAFKYADRIVAKTLKQALKAIA